MKCDQTENMAEETVDELRQKKKLSRRGFVKLIGLGAASVAVPEAVKWGVEQLAGRQDQIARLALATEVRSGAFRMEQIGKLQTLTELRESLIDSLKALSGISESQIMVGDGDQRISVRFGAATESFFPASVIKVPICNEAWKMGSDMGKTFLTPELADQILHKSYPFKDLVMQLPAAEGKSPDQLELIVRDMLENADIPPKNKTGELPLRVGMGDLFGYLNRMKLPNVMREAMRQTQDDKRKNYGVSTVLLDTIGEDIPAFFKIGLIYDQGKDPRELVNSYYFQLGNSFKTLGYAKGLQVDDVHAAMLHTAARITSYMKNRQDPHP